VWRQRAEIIFGSPTDLSVIFSRRFQGRNTIVFLAPKLKLVVKWLCVRPVAEGGAATAVADPLDVVGEAHLPLDFGVVGDFDSLSRKVCFDLPRGVAKLLVSLEAILIVVVVLHLLLDTVVSDVRTGGAALRVGTSTGPSEIRKD
jgi:hypothetical protein